MIVHELAKALQAISDPIRLKIVRILMSRTMESLSVTDVSKVLGISQPAASQHIKTLKSIGILNAKRDANRMLYTIDLDALLRFKAIWDDQYAKMHTVCPHDMRCEICPSKRTCA